MLVIREMKMVKAREEMVKQVNSTTNKTIEYTAWWLVPSSQREPFNKLYRHAVDDFPIHSSISQLGRHRYRRQTS